MNNILYNLMLVNFISSIFYILYLIYEKLKNKDNIDDILELNSDVDLIAVPRVNKVIGLTQDHINKWGWRVDALDRVNYPDFQSRIFKNVSYIKWEGAVHEKPVGWKTGTHLPYESDDFALIHIKEIARQEKQNELYSTI